MDGIVYYFLINDLNIVGKMDDYTYYLYDKNEGWIPDGKHLLADRLIGYDESEPKDSPYAIGNTDMLSRVNEISEEEATKIMEKCKVPLI